MALPFIIANLPAGNNPASVLDADFAALGSQINSACSTGGTANAVQLTPITNMPSLNAYAQGNLFSFQAQATSTGAVTLGVAGLGSFNVYKAPGVQAGAGDLVQNYNYVVMYSPTLVGGVSPGFIIVNPPIPSVPSPLGGQFTNLKIAVASNSTITLSYSQVTVSNVGGGVVVLPAGSFTISTGANNVVNGYDAVSSALAQATWYAIFAIFNPSSQVSGGYMSSNLTPNLPSGFSYFQRLGYVRTAPLNTSLMGTLQIGRDAQYVVGLAQSTAMPILTSGVVGSVSVPTWVSVATGNFVPPSASAIKITVFSPLSSQIIVAPNNSYGAQGSTTNPPPFSVNTPGGVQSNIVPDMLLETSNIFWASQAGGANMTLFCRGWKDNL